MSTASPPQAPGVFGQPQQERQSSTPPSPSSKRGLIGGVKSVASSALHIASLALAETEPVEAIDSAVHASKGQLELLFEQISHNTLARDAISIIKAGSEGKTSPLDDRNMLLEKVVTLLSSLPPDSSVGTSLQNVFIRILWEDIPKPPATLVGKYRFREADGGHNNPFLPELGKAGTPYARTTPNLHPFPESLPDVGVIFDSLMRRDGFKPHPSGISSSLFAMAVLITHSVFQSDHDDPNINLTSSYLDLSPIYGNNAEEQMKVRTGKQGEIHPDVLSSNRIFLMSPGAVALAIVFARNHNWIARKLVEVNQHGEFREWDKLNEADQKQQDLALFNLARNINCLWFEQVIFQDYIRVILNVNRTTSTWSLVPTGEIKAIIGGEVPRGTGNHVSTEFNSLYHWHAAVSAQDAEWLEEQFRRWSKKPFDQMTPEDLRGIWKGANEELGDDPKKYTFGGFQRTGPDGTGPFRDEDIVHALTNSTDWVAGAFKARGIPEVMRIIECMSMDTARTKWRCASLNEFRGMLGLMQYKSFEEWNSSPEIAETARRLYRSIDNLELYPGLMCEEPKPSTSGSGLAPGYTISRAILSDAAALVRGDRFLTYEATAGSLTSYHYRDLQPDYENGAFGGQLGKLLLRHFPRAYSYNSIYALFPFTTPETTKAILTDLGIAHKYDFSRPVSSAAWASIKNYKDAEAVFSDTTAFANVYGPALATMTRKGEYHLLDNLERSTSPKATSDFSKVITAGVYPSQWPADSYKVAAQLTKAKLSSAAWSSGANVLSLDVIADIAIPVVAEFIAQKFGVPLKSKENPLGLWNTTQFYEALTEMWTFAYLNFDPSLGFKLYEKAMQASEILLAIIETRVMQTQGTPIKVHELLVDLKHLFGVESQGVVMSDEASKTCSRALAASNRPYSEVAGILTIAAIRLVTAVSDAALALDFYLADDQKAHLDQICRAAKRQANLADQGTIELYVQEALRLHPAVAGSARRALRSVKLSDGTQIEQGQLVWIDAAAVNRDEHMFPQADKVVANRDPSVYAMNERISNLANDQGQSLNTTIATAIVAEVCALGTPSRAPGRAGSLGAVRVVDGMAKAYLSPNGPPNAFPSSMMIVVNQG